MIKRTLWIFFLMPLWVLASVPVQEITTPKGVHVWLYEDHTASLVSINAVFRDAGNVSDPEGKEGRSLFYVNAVFEGAGNLSGREICDKIEDMGSGLHAVSGGDVLHFNVLYIKENQQPTLDIARSVLMAPTFAPEALARVQKRLVAEEALAQDNPNTLCERAQNKAAYPGHPYARHPSVQSFRSITQKDLIAFKEQRLAKDQLIVVIAGDITAQEVAACMDKLFGDLPEKAKDLNISHVSSRVVTEGVPIKKSLPQSLISWYQQGVQALDPDFFPLFVANRILSGGLQSRLYKKLRVETGLVYFIDTGMNISAYTEQFSGHTRTESRDRVIEIIRQEWRKMAEHGVTEEELLAAKKYLNGSFVLAFTDYGSIASLLGYYALLGFSPDVIETRADKINAVTLESINAAIKRHFRPDALTFVSVGPK